MKFSLKKQILVFVAAALSTASSASEYRSDLLALAEQFDSSDTEVQYAARRGLELLVANASAPDVDGGVSKINSDLLYALRSGDVSREAKKYYLRQVALVGSSKAVSQLSRMMLGEDALLAENARKALESIEGPQASSALRRAFPKVDAARQRDLIFSLGKRSDTASIAFVGKNLKNANTGIAVAAAHALGRVGSARAQALLLSRYGDVQDKVIKQTIERSLLMSGAEDPATLKALFEDGSDVAIRRAALRALLKQGGGGSVEALRSGLTDTDSDMRSIAIRTALASGESAYRDLVVERSKEMENADLAVLLSGLDSVESGAAERIAIRAFDRGDGELMGLAIEALGSCGSALSVDLLLSAYGKEEKSLRLQAASSIGRLRSSKMDERLASMLRSDSNEDVMVALELLVYRNIPQAKSLLLGLVAGDDGDLVKAALQTLTAIASEDDLDELLALSKNAQGESRRYIVAVLKKLAPTVGSEALQAQVGRL